MLQEVRSVEVQENDKFSEKLQQISFTITEVNKILKQKYFKCLS